MAPRRISVIVPTRDRPATLRQALASIRARAGETHSFEILVGDNGASPETRAVCAEFGAKHLPVTVAGASAARNAGLDAATGEYLCFLDDDDVWLRGHLEGQFAQLDARPELEAVLGQVIYTDQHLAPTGNPFPETHPGEGDELLRRMLSGFFPQIGTLVVRADVGKAVDRFDLALLGGQDLDWMLRLARRRAMGFEMRPCILFRGRAPGSYDQLQFRRIGFDRRVFFRHATPEWRIWSSPLAFSRAYGGALQHFHIHFSEAAELRADAGRRLASLRAMAIAAGVFPLRTLCDLFRDTPLRRALKRLFIGRSRDAEAARN